MSVVRVHKFWGAKKNPIEKSHRLSLSEDWLFNYIRTMSADLQKTGGSHRMRRHVMFKTMLLFSNVTWKILPDGYNKPAR